MQTPVREHWGAVVGIAFGLLLLLALVSLLQFQRAGATDGAALLEQWFEVGELPSGLAVAGAADLPDPIPGRVDWARIETGPEHQPPREVLVVRYPPFPARSQLRRLFLSDEIRRATTTGWGPRGGA